MFIELDDSIRQRLVEARKKKHLTQLELHRLSKISERTIKDIESGRRNSFSETTLLMLSRVLELDYTELFPSDNHREEAKTPVRKFKPRFILILIPALIALSVIASFSLRNNSNDEVSREDWVDKVEKLRANHYTSDWGLRQGVQVNYYHLKQIAVPNEIIPIELKWSYHFEPASTPLYYVSAYTEWDPDDEIRLFDGILEGDGSKINNFVLTSPKNCGIYRIRLFFTSAYAPMSSFYGHPPSNQLSSPSSVPYLEITIEVVK